MPRNRGSEQFTRCNKVVRIAYDRGIVTNLELAFFQESH
jgi:hypothetical protein